MLYGTWKIQDYKKLLSSLIEKGFRLVALEDVSGESGTIGLRHDLDDIDSLHFEKTRAILEIERKWGARSTWFFRVRQIEGLGEEIIRFVSDKGFEVGLHIDEETVEECEKHLKRLRELVPVKGAAFHMNYWSFPCWRDSLHLEELNLDYEAYHLSMSKYISDCRGRRSFECASEVEYCEPWKISTVSGKYPENFTAWKCELHPTQVIEHMAVEDSAIMLAHPVRCIL